jgi:hypothetical protein
VFAILKKSPLMPIELLYDADRTLTGEKEFIIKLLKIIRVIYKYRKKIK